MPRVSVIIPAHNAEAFLPAALRSVEEQSYTDWEIVAVDDGSTDGTWAILERAGPRMRALQNEVCHGVAAARNRAIAASDSELIVFLDADDLLLPAYLGSQIALFDAESAKGRKIGVVTCDAQLIEDNHYAPHTYLDTVRDRDSPLTLDLVLRRNPIYISSLVPREAGECAGWFDRELAGAADFSLWVKILEEGFEAIRNPNVLAVYRRHSNSMSSDIARQGADSRRAYEMALNRRSLDRRQRRIARRAIRYLRAMEAVATARFSTEGPSAGQLLRLTPLLAWVALTNPRWWRQWLAILRTGRQPAVGRRNLTRTPSS
jgi:glycosyltransferase involved in cell wall biosynthesis